MEENKGFDIKKIAHDLYDKSFNLGGFKVSELTLIIAGLGLLSFGFMFLPFLSTKSSLVDVSLIDVSVSENYFSMWGMISTLLIVVMLICAFLNQGLLTLIAAALKALYFLYNFSASMIANSTAYMQFSIGAYLMLIEAIITVAMSFLLFIAAREDQKVSFNSESINEGIDTIKDSLKDIDNPLMVKCPNCGRMVLKGKKFCSHCGSPLETEEEKVEEEEIECPNCGTKVKQGTKFCPECGTKIPEPVVQEFPDVCPNCGTKIEGHPKFCPECGTKLVEDEDHEVL